MDDLRQMLKEVVQEAITPVVVAVTKLEHRMDRLEQRMDKVETELKEIKKLTADIPLIRQAVLETNRDVKALEVNFKQLQNDVNHQQFSIEVLSKEQFQIKTEIQALKNK